MRIATKKPPATFAIAAALIGMFVVSRAVAAPSDFDGVWLPDVKDQKRQETQNVPPWKPEIVPQIQRLVDEEKAGRPFLVFSHCLPHGMPSWMLITHNAFEWLTTPGRVTMLGEVDSNRMRRIYTDGRSHPEDPDLTMHGHSIGHWDGDVLVVDTTAVAPQAYIATTEAVGVPNNGDMHIVERLSLAKPNVLRDELEITAPKVLTAPWRTTRFFIRYRSLPNVIDLPQSVNQLMVGGRVTGAAELQVPSVLLDDDAIDAGIEVYDRSLAWLR